MSADGRFVAITSYATNLVPGDTNGGPTEFGPDIFIKDRETGKILRASPSSQGGQADNFGAIGSMISGSGRAAASPHRRRISCRRTLTSSVTFIRREVCHLESEFNNLVLDDTNGDPDPGLGNDSHPSKQ